jgi:hypothetical protein
MTPDHLARLIDIRPAPGIRPAEPALHPKGSVSESHVPDVAGIRGRSFGLLTLAAALSAACVACSHPARLTVYDESLRPAGYHWTAHQIGRSRFVEYYGIDPANGWTVYVGPDGVYYSFRHAAPITTRDLRSYWNPHDAPVSASASSPARRRAGPPRSR